jgi:tRNA-specific 2-thiouridylase
MKIAVAMSGGVDSSVTAALLKEQGHEVIGLTMQILPHQDAVNYARKTAEKLGISHHVIDFRDIFARSIIDNFCREYSLGRTPNPCVLCNHLIKFGALWEKAAELGADCIATGHYARIEKHGTTITLSKGADKNKDQSYFLCSLTREQLIHVMFPIGQLTKTKVRQIAREMNIPTASRPDSQEICFIPDNDYAGFLKARLPQASVPGPVVDMQGNIMGQHQGITAYTIGQRHGLGIANTEPLYVIAIIPGQNSIVVGAKKDIFGTELIAGNLNWITPERPIKPFTVKARIRYHHPEAEAKINPLDNDNVYVKFAEPQMAITPGQTVAFYDGESVLGGGTIIKQGR